MPTKTPLPIIEPEKAAAIQQLYDVRVDELVPDRQQLTENAEQYPEMQADVDPELVDHARRQLLSLPMIHRTSHPNFGGGDGHDQILPTSELGYRPSGTNTYSLDRRMGLNEFTFLKWGGLEGEDDFLDHTRYAVLIDPRVILKMSETLATPHDVAALVGEDMLHSRVLSNIPLPARRRVARAAGATLDVMRDVKFGVKRAVGEVAMRASAAVTYHKTRITQGSRRAEREARKVRRDWDRKYRKSVSQERRESHKRDRHIISKDREATRLPRALQHIRLGEESQRILEDYYAKIVGGEDWLEIEARRLAGMVQSGEVSADSIPLTADTLGEIKVAGPIPKEAVIGVVDLWDKVSVQAYLKVAERLGFDVEAPSVLTLKKAAAKAVSQQMLDTLDDALHL